MLRLVAASFAVVFLLIGSTAAQSDGGVFPVLKVIKLLGQLHDTITSEGEKESAQYQTFACFCKEEETKQAAQISVGKSEVETLSATLSELRTTQAAKQAELMKKKARVEEITKDMEDTKATHEKEKAEYTAAEADLSKAMSSLESAGKALKEKDPDAAAMMQLSRGLEIAHMLSPEGPKSQILDSFVQKAKVGAKVDPENPEYKFHSQGLVDIIQELLEQFTSQKKDLDENWKRTQTIYNKMMADLSDDLNSTQQAITDLQEEIAAIEETLEKHKSDVQKNANLIRTDDQYLNDVAEQCAARAKDWDQRSATRSSELQTIEAALQVLSKDVAGNDMSVNRMRTDSHKTTFGAALAQKPVTLLQASASKSTITLHGSHGSIHAKQEKVVAVLQKSAKQLGSSVLANLAQHAAEDPFPKVKELIQDLVERLNAERNDEISKQSYCNQQVAKATQDRDHHHVTMKKLDAQIADLDAHLNFLQMEIKESKEQKQHVTAALAEDSKLRNEDKENNQQSIKDANEGLQGTQDALKSLKDFYRMTGFRAKQHDGTADAQKTLDRSYQFSRLDAGFQGAYHGKQDESVNIIGMLEVVVSDFKKSLAEVKENESKAQQSFVKYERQSKATLARLETTIQLDQEDTEASHTSREERLADLNTQTKLVDSAIKTLEDLKPVCVDTSMKYAERSQKRQQEMQALNTALCTLDTEGTEEQCQ